MIQVKKELVGQVKHVKLIGLCLVAVFALGGLVASVAQAEGPEWGRCLHIEPSKGKEIKKGNYEDPNCTKVAMKEKKHELVPSHKGHYEWYGGTKTLCEKKGSSTFKYKDKECSVEATKKGVPDSKGKYEWGPGPKFTAEGGAGVLTTGFTACETESGERGKQEPREDCVGAGDTHDGYDNGIYNEHVECESEHATGEATGTDEVANINVRFKGCTSFGIPATTPGEPAGEIQVKPLKGKLGYINKGNKEVGVLLEPATAGGLFAELEIFEGAGIVRVGVGGPATGSFYEAAHTPGTPTGNDGIISPITPVDQMTHTFSQKYTEEVTGEPCENCTHEETIGSGKELVVIKNVPSKFEGGRLEALEAYLESEGENYEWIGSGEEITNTNTVEGEVEIKG